MLKRTPQTNQQKSRSMNRYIECYGCNWMSPKEFVILLCDHVICAECLQGIKHERYDYDEVKCFCGVSTYFQGKGSQCSTGDRRSVGSFGQRQEKRMSMQCRRSLGRKARHQTQKTEINMISPEPETLNTSFQRDKLRFSSSSKRSSLEPKTPYYDQDRITTKPHSRPSKKESLTIYININGQRECKHGKLQKKGLIGKKNWVIQI